MLYFLLRQLYSLLFLAAIPFIYIQKLIRSRHNPGYRQHWCERFGFCPLRAKNSIWIHAVSVGENIAIAPLIKKLHQHHDNTIIITVMTPTGRDQIARLYADMPRIQCCYLPYDIGVFMWFFLNRIKPKIGIIMETELWPNLLHSCRKRQIPVILNNARLSLKSKKGYAKIRFILPYMFDAITQLNAQTETDAERFIDLGMEAWKITVTGNIKYDFTTPHDLLSKATQLRDCFGNRPVWIAASTRAGEDEIILDAHKQLKEKFQNALLILVPRHPERFDLVFNLSQARGFSTQRRTKCLDNTVIDNDVFIGDTLGELMLYYAASDVTFVGGSLSGNGGHNTLEPAALSKPVLSGPSTYNFSEPTAHLCDANAMTVIHNSQEIADCLIDFFTHPDTIRQKGNAALAVFTQNKGALEKQYRIIKTILNDIATIKSNTK
ncbi:MAG: lipid IV(A) 3-deoxy-D-manno-octulosonic acid transferase [Francisellaceae bacterium]